MQIEYDREVDALYIYLKEKKYTEVTKELGEGVIIDLDKKGEVIGLEVLDASKKYNRKNISKFSARDLIKSKTLISA